MTAVALYCELVYTFGRERQRKREREREDSLYFCNCHGLWKWASNSTGAITYWRQKMTGYTLNIRSHLHWDLTPLLKTELRGEVLWQWQPYMLTTQWGRWMIIIIVSDVWPGIDGVAAACFSLRVSTTDVFNRLAPFLARGQCRWTEKWTLAKCFQTYTNAYTLNCHHNAFVGTVWGCPFWVMIYERFIKYAAISKDNSTGQRVEKVKSYFILLFLPDGRNEHILDLTRLSILVWQNTLLSDSTATVHTPPSHSQETIHRLCISICYAAFQNTHSFPVVISLSCCMNW